MAIPILLGDCCVQTVTVNTGTPGGVNTLIMCLYRLGVVFPTIRAVFGVILVVGRRLLRITDTGPYFCLHLKGLSVTPYAIIGS
jgi:hypothetical protein